MPTPARTSREVIVSAARSILEEDGLEALTMQRVAQAVGVRAPSLYKHVRNRSDLVRLVSEDVAAALAATVADAVPSSDPAADLRTIAVAFRRFARNNPRAYGLIFGDLPDEWRAAPEALARANEALLRTTTALAGPDHALEAARTVVAWAHGFVSMELAGAFRLGGSVDDAFAFGADRLADALAGPPGGVVAADGGR
jgi:AcrR family transcriptional regulator